MGPCRRELYRLPGQGAGPNHGVVVRLAYAVVTGREQQVWDSRGRPVPADAPPGAPVVVGPAGADPRPAAAELTRLVAAGGVTVAGAGVELCPGFVSARLDGARGDRRDAVLAALQVLGLDGLHRLGERAGVLVALFGAEATKPVGAAASRAIADGRWAALQLASSASALLGSEQVERLLHLGAQQTTGPAVGRGAAEGGPGVEPEPHAMPSAMAAHLAQVLGPLSPRRRLDLLVDLWNQVAATQEAARRAQRRRATQAKQSRMAELVRRHATHEDELVLDHVRAALGHEPTLGEAARWFPEPWHWAQFMNRAMHNAMAATVLLRTAVAVADHGLEDGLARCADQLRAAAALMDPHAAGRAARRVPGLTGLPARPGCYVRDLAVRLHAPAEPYVRQRLARAVDYAGVALEAVTDLVLAGREGLNEWSLGGMTQWRAAVGYTPERPPAAWAQPPADDSRPPLADRVADRPDAAPEELETVGDLLWYGELADALAQLNGHDHATVRFQVLYPLVDFYPTPEADLVPRLDTISSALAGAAQLVSLGARPPRQCRDWQELAAGLTGSLEITQALVAAFQVPEPLAAVDGAVVPGTEMRIECARDPRTLAGWSSYMGNCIAEPYYVEQAAKGACVLAALRDPDGRIVANLEIRHRRSGWQVTEMQARFNTDPDPGLRERVVRWLAALPPPAPAEPPARREPLPPSARDRSSAGRPVRVRRADRVFRELSAPLAELAERALTHPSTVEALLTLEALNAARTAGTAGTRRSGRDRHRSRTATTAQAGRTAEDAQASVPQARRPVRPPEARRPADTPEASPLTGIVEAPHLASTQAAPHGAGAPETPHPTGTPCAPHPAGGPDAPPSDVPHPAGGPGAPRLAGASGAPRLMSPAEALRLAGFPAALRLTGTLDTAGLVGAAPTFRSTGDQVPVPGTDVLTALRRLPADRIDDACLDALSVIGLPELWRATAVRPLALALNTLDPELRARFDPLDLLLADAPLPGSLRKLARHGAIAPARSMELVARRIRAALGRLARAGDPVLAQQVIRRADATLLCPLIIAVTTWPPSRPTVPITAPREATVPGFPRSDLEDPSGPWRRALPDAAELGADLDAFWDRIAAGGLRVPAAWLGNGGWPALWQRATRPSARPRAGTTR